ncbi:MAG: YciI family protein [Ferrovibrio sp.]
MFVILLKFSAGKSRAAQFMDGHNAWLKQGFADGVFLLAGSIKPGQGGAILAHGITAEDLEQRVQADPFVAEDVVQAEILEIAPAKADERLKFMVA